MLYDEYVSLLLVKSKGELLERIVRFAKALGFQNVSAIAVVDGLQGGEPAFLAVDNAPEEYEGYSQGKTDPVLQHCKRSSLPIIWDQQTYVAAGRGDKWEEQARFGYRHGICMAMHMPNGHHFCFGVDSDVPLPTDPAEVARLVSAVQLFAAYAQQAAAKTILPKAAVGEESQLTQRELEVLRWTLDGKTAWEVASILGIAENTTTRHAFHATQKLGCSNKHHAAVKALRFGLIR